VLPRTTSTLVGAKRKRSTEKSEKKNEEKDDPKRPAKQLKNVIRTIEVPKMKELIDLIPTASEGHIPPLFCYDILIDIPVSISNCTCAEVELKNHLSISNHKQIKRTKQNKTTQNKIPLWLTLS
jgi:hypothetical protein